MAAYTNNGSQKRNGFFFKVLKQSTLQVKWNSSGTILELAFDGCQ
ncbi:hypothetical protein ACM66Z_06070 [Sulfurovum sp. ST-21]|nr:hypothetical protein [Sulfurovum indicum]